MAPDLATSLSTFGSTYSTVAYNSSITALEKSYHWQLSLPLG